MSSDVLMVRSSECRSAYWQSRDGSQISQERRQRSEADQAAIWPHETVVARSLSRIYALVRRQMI